VIGSRSANSLVVLFWLRVFLAVGWIAAGLEKMVSPQWWIGDGLLEFLAHQHSAAVPFFRPVMDRAVAPTAAPVAIVVMVSQLWCGVAIAIGKHLRLALVWACVLNVTFILAGRLTPSIFYLAVQAVLLLATAYVPVVEDERPKVPVGGDRVL
jgi:thiosulfate dehydrogenase (quinone) large subunit